VKPNYTVIEGNYLHDILQQPASLTHTAKALPSSKTTTLLAALKNQAFDRIILTGMGASLYASYLALPELSQTGLPVAAIETSELLHSQNHALNNRTLLIAISQSGQSIEILHLLKKLPQQCHLVGITNTPNSPLHQHASTPILMHAGTETSVSCKTYTATVTALTWLIQVIHGTPPDQASDNLLPLASTLATYLNHWRSHLNDLATHLHPARNIFLLGRGTSLAAAYTGALICKEAARFGVEAMSSPAFRHGPIEMTSPSTAILILQGTEPNSTLNQQLHQHLQQIHAPSFLITPDHPIPALSTPKAPPNQLPIVEILPFQMLSLALAALSHHEAGKFEKTSKITSVE
jgi:glucosamine--fructose-6-phosphate aminotransferase (isomerizing)